MSVTVRGNGFQKKKHTKRILTTLSVELKLTVFFKIVWIARFIKIDQSL